MVVMKPIFSLSVVTLIRDVATPSSFGLGDMAQISSIWHDQGSFSNLSVFNAFS